MERRKILKFGGVLVNYFGSHCRPIGHGGRSIPIICYGLGVPSGMLMGKLCSSVSSGIPIMCFRPYCFMKEKKKVL